MRKLAGTGAILAGALLPLAAQAQEGLTDVADSGDHGNDDNCKNDGNDGNAAEWK